MLRRHGDALRPAPLPLSGEIPRGFLRYMDAGDYESYSPLFRSAFSAAVRAVGRGGTSPCLRDALGARSRRKAARIPTLPSPSSPRACRSGCCSGSVLDGARGAPGRLVPRCRDLDRGRPSGPGGARRPEGVRPDAQRAAASESRGEDHVTSVWSELRRIQPDARRDPTVLGNLFLLQAASCEAGVAAASSALERSPSWGRSPEWAERPTRRTARGRKAPKGRAGDPVADWCWRPCGSPRASTVYRPRGGDR